MKQKPQIAILVRHRKNNLTVEHANGLSGAQFHLQRTYGCFCYGALGGGGRTGAYLVQHLINHGYHLKLLLRNAENFTIQNPVVEIIKGDALDRAAVRLLVQGCQAVISTIGQRPGERLVATAATTNVLIAMGQCNIQRYILLAGLNVECPSDKKGHETILATEWMKANFPQIQEDRQKAYSLLVSSNVSWTMVRVPLIEFIDERRELRVSLEDCLGSKISAADIASFLDRQLDDTTYFREAPFIANP